MQNASTNSGTDDKSSIPAPNEQIAGELTALAQHDLKVRERLLQENKLSPEYNAEMEAVHKANAARLKEIIDRIGWPSKSKVGTDASEAAWLIAQHAIGEPAFYEKKLCINGSIER